MAGILGSGDLYFDRQDDNGNSTGLLHIGNTTSFMITESSTLKERTSKMKKTYGQTLDSVAIHGAPKVSFTLNDLIRSNLALIHMGDDADATQALAAEVTKTFAVESVKVGVFYDLGAADISITSVKDASNADFTTYEMDEDGGLFKFTEAPTEAVTVTYSVPAMSGYTITGSTRSTIKGRLLFIGKNLADQTNMRVDCKESQLTPKNGLDYLSDDFADAQYEGTLNTPSGETSPYSVRMLSAA
ncbi:MAG: hypothetical protein AB7D37_06170 [Desulfovibrio sp.]